VTIADWVTVCILAVLAVTFISIALFYNWPPEIPIWWRDGRWGLNRWRGARSTTATVYKPAG
jgi:hypothetical protein